MNPPLTTLRQDKAGLGTAAGEAIVRLAEDGPPDGPVVLPVTLVERGSSAAPRA